jgi:hypothetical protein
MLAPIQTRTKYLYLTTGVSPVALLPLVSPLYLRGAKGSARDRLLHALLAEQAETGIPANDLLDFLLESPNLARVVHTSEAS